MYYRKTTDADWILYQSIDIEDADKMSYSSVIDGLDWSTSYDFTVTVKRPGPKGEGSKDTYTTQTTLCDGKSYLSNPSYT